MDNNTSTVYATSLYGDLFYDAFKASAVGIALENLEGRPLFVNPALCSMLGFTEEEMRSKQCVDFSPQEDAAKDWALFQKLREGSISSYQIDKRFFRRDRSLVWGRLSISLLQNGTSRFVVAMVEDITEQRKAEEALQLLTEQMALSVEFETLLSDLSRTFISLREDDVDVNIERGLARVGRFLQMDRITLFEFTPARTDLLAAYSWHTPEATPSPQSVATKKLRWWRARILSGETSVASQLEDLPEEASAEKEYLRERGITSIASIPLKVGGETNGAISFVTLHRRVSWTEELLNQLRVIGEIFWNALKRKRNMEALHAAQAIVHESEQRFRLVANTVPVMIWMAAIDKRCTYFNQGWVDFTGRSTDTESGSDWTEGIHPDDLQRSFETYTGAFGRREPFQIEYRRRRHDGEYRWVFDQGVSRFNGDGSFAGYIGSAIDVTERKLAEEALSTVSQKLIQAQEEERTRLGRELHDDINQKLALLAISLERLGKDSSATASALRASLREASGHIGNIGLDIQALSHRLHSSKLELLGLTKAAGALCRDLSERHGVEIDFQSNNIPTPPQEVSLCLFRVLQEALQNAVKHSGSRKIQVVLQRKGLEIELTVHDSGIGFELEQALAGQGLGLTSMRERLKLVNGELAIHSELQVGTTICARVRFGPRVRSVGATE